MRKRVYIAGPISKGDLCDNVNRATAAFVALAKAGFAPFCPHWSVYSKPASRWVNAYDDRRTGKRVTERIVKCDATVTGNDEMTHADWMGVDLPWVAVSDALLRLPGESAGADLEESCARENGVPVFHGVAELVAHFAPNGGA